jgi:hypothetical protein
MRLTCFFLTFFGISLLGGCSGEAEYVPVSGQVTLDGVPLVNVQVLFQPVAKKPGGDAIGMGSFALTDADGRFSLEAMTRTPTKGAISGKHLVRISDLPPKEGAVSEDTDAANPTGKTTKKFVNRVPEKYNLQTELTFEVPNNGTDKADFLLESGKRKSTNK